jgi:hypothetical protein
MPSPPIAIGAIDRLFEFSAWSPSSKPLGSTAAIDHHMGDLGTSKLGGSGGRKTRCA